MFCVTNNILIQVCRFSVRWAHSVEGLFKHQQWSREANHQQRLSTEHTEHYALHRCGHYQLRHADQTFSFFTCITGKRTNKPAGLKIFEKQVLRRVSVQTYPEVHQRWWQATALQSRWRWWRPCTEDSEHLEDHWGTEGSAESRLWLDLQKDGLYASEARRQVWRERGNLED